jgi:hypothetical protein
MLHGSKELTMRTLMTNFSAVVLGLAAVAAASADGKGGSHHGGNYRNASYRSSSSHRYTNTTRYSSHDARHYRTHYGTRSHSARSYANYNLKYGTKFSRGYYYKGRHHRHWSYRYWSYGHRCWYYYDPCCRCCYYWCATDSCYYPTSCIDNSPPTENDLVAEVNDEVPEVSAPEDESGPAMSTIPSQNDATLKTAARIGDSDDNDN